MPSLSFPVPGHKSQVPNQKGIALVLVLMVVTLLTAMVVEFAYGVYVSTSALHNWQTSQRLSVAAKSAVKLGSKLITQSNSLHPSYTYPGSFELSQKIPFDDIDGVIAIKIEDENAKFNLNSLVGMNRQLNTPAYEAFLRLLKALGMKKSIADAVVAWIYPELFPAQADQKRPRELKYLASVDELTLIPGISRDDYYKLLPYVTIYGSENVPLPQININTAGIPVLMSISDSITEEIAQRIVKRREASPFEQPSEIFRVVGIEMRTMSQTLPYITTSARAYRVVATAESDGIKRIVECVLDGNGRLIRYWREI